MKPIDPSQLHALSAAVLSNVRVDGVVVIPRAHEHDVLRKGEPLASVFERFGIL